MFCNSNVVNNVLKDNYGIHQHVCVVFATDGLRLVLYVSGNIMERISPEKNITFLLIRSVGYCV